MRGKAHFRKIIQRMPSGKHRWAINDFGNELVAYGVAPSKTAARTAACTKERELLQEYERAPKPMPADPVYRFRNTDRPCNRPSN